VGTPPTRTFSAEVQEVYSGDDLVLMVDLGIDSLHKRVRARLFGVDTPDGYREDSSSDAGKVREEVKKLVKGAICTITLHSERRTGWIVSIYLLNRASGERMSLNQHLIDQGYIFKGAPSNGKNPQK
jgi:hypothetical protein